MNDFVKKVLGVVALAVVLFLGVTFPHTPAVNNANTNAHDASHDAANGYGSVSNLNPVDQPWVSIGGARSYVSSIPFAATSSVLCSLRNPYGATSTLKNFSFYESTSSIPTTTYVSLSTSTVQIANNASSTNAWLHDVVPANGSQYGQAWMPNSATSTGTGASATGDSSLYFGLTASGTSAYIIKPLEYLNFKIGTGTPGSFATFPQGFCTYDIRPM